MAKNWSDLKLELLQPPCSIDQAVERLLLVIKDEEKLAIAALPEENLFDLHFSLGLAIRNAWLRRDDSELLKACRICQPDDASHAVIVELWRALQS